MISSEGRAGALRREGATRPNDSRGGSALGKALDKLEAEIREGLKHGFFDYEVSCQLVKHRKRELTIKAGKSHRYIIPEEDLLE